MRGRGIAMRTLNRHLIELLEGLYSVIWLSRSVLPCASVFRASRENQGRLVNIAYLVVQ